MCVWIPGSSFGLDFQWGVPRSPHPQQSHFCYLVGKLQGPWKLPCWSLPAQTRKRVHCTLGWLGRWLLSTRGTCGEEKLWVRALSAVTDRSFPLTAITQRSTLGHPSHAARLNLQCNRNFHRASFSDTATPSVKLLCSRAQKALIVHRAHRALPPYCLICNLAFYYSVAASSHCCNSFKFSIAFLQLGLFSIFPGVKHNKIQTIDLQSRGKENHICFSLSFHGF